MYNHANILGVQQATVTPETIRKHPTTKEKMTRPTRLAAVTCPTGSNFPTRAWRDNSTLTFSSLNRSSTSLFGLKESLEKWRDSYFQSSYFGRLAATSHIWSLQNTQMFSENRIYLPPSQGVKVFLYLLSFLSFYQRKNKLGRNALTFPSFFE